MTKSQLLTILQENEIPDDAIISMECLDGALVNYVALIKVSKDSKEIRFSDDWKIIVEVVEGYNLDEYYDSDKQCIEFIKDENNNNISFEEYQKHIKENYKRW